MAVRFAVDTLRFAAAEWLDAGPPVFIAGP